METASPAYCYVHVVQDFVLHLSKCLLVFVTAIVVTVGSRLKAVGLH